MKKCMICGKESYELDGLCYASLQEALDNHFETDPHEYEPEPEHPNVDKIVWK